MNSDNSQFLRDNNHSTKSNLLSVTCTLILITILLSSNESASWLLRITLVVWLIHATVSQVCSTNDFKLPKFTWLRDAKFDMDMIALDYQMSPSKANASEQIALDGTAESSKPELSRLWSTTVAQNAAFRIAKAQISTGTMLMKLSGVRDESLLGNLTPSQFYRSSWHEDISLRTDPRKQIAFGFGCFIESCIFVILDSYISNLCRKLSGKIKRLISN